MADGTPRRGATIAEKIAQFRSYAVQKSSERAACVSTNRTKQNDEFWWQKFSASRPDAAPRTPHRANTPSSPGQPASAISPTQPPQQQQQSNAEPDSRYRGLDQGEGRHARPASLQQQVTATTSTISKASSTAALQRLAREHPSLYNAVLSLERGPDGRLSDAAAQMVGQALARTTPSAATAPVAAESGEGANVPARRRAGGPAAGTVDGHITMTIRPHSPQSPQRAQAHPHEVPQSRSQVQAAAAVAASVGMVHAEESVDQLLARYRSRDASRAEGSGGGSLGPAGAATAVLSASVAKTAAPRSRPHTAEAPKTHVPQAAATLPPRGSDAAAGSQTGGNGTLQKASAPTKSPPRSPSPERRPASAPATPSSPAGTSQPVTAPPAEAPTAGSLASAKSSSAAGKLQKVFRLATIANRIASVASSSRASASDAAGSSGGAGVLGPSQPHPQAAPASATPAAEVQQPDSCGQQQPQPPPQQEERPRHPTVAHPPAEPATVQRSRQGSSGGGSSGGGLFSEPSLSAFHAQTAAVVAAEVESMMRVQTEVAAAAMSSRAAAMAAASDAAASTGGGPTVKAAAAGQAADASVSLSAAHTADTASMQSSFAFATPVGSGSASTAVLTPAAAEPITTAAAARRVQFSPNHPQVHLFTDGPPGAQASPPEPAAHASTASSATPSAAPTTTAGSRSGSNSPPTARTPSPGSQPPPGTLQPVFLLPPDLAPGDPSGPCPTHIFVPADPTLPPALVSIPGFEPLPPHSLAARPAAGAGSSRRRSQSSSPGRSPSPSRHSRHGSPSSPGRGSPSEASRQEPPAAPAAAAAAAHATSISPAASSASPGPEPAASATGQNVNSGGHAVGVAGFADAAKEFPTAPAAAEWAVVASADADAEFEVELLAAEQAAARVAHESTTFTRNRLSRLLDEVAAFRRTEGERQLREGERLKVLGELKAMTVDQLGALLGPDSELLKEINRFKNLYMGDLALVKAEADEHTRQMLDALQGASEAAAAVKEAVVESALAQQEEVLQLLDKLVPPGAPPSPPPPPPQQSLQALLQAVRCSLSQQQQEVQQPQSQGAALEQPGQQSSSGALAQQPHGQMVLGGAPPTTDLLNSSWWTRLLDPAHLDTLAACKAAAAEGAAPAGYAAHALGPEQGHATGSGAAVGPGQQMWPVPPAAPWSGAGVGAAGSILAHQVAGLASAIRTSLDDPAALGLGRSPVGGASSEELSVSAITRAARQVSRTLDLAVREYLDRTSEATSTSTPATGVPTALSGGPCGPTHNSLLQPQPLPGLPPPLGWLQYPPIGPIAAPAAADGQQQQYAQLAPASFLSAATEGGPWVTQPMAALQPVMLPDGTVLQHSLTAQPMAVAAAAPGASSLLYMPQPSAPSHGGGLGGGVSGPVVQPVVMEYGNPAATAASVSIAGQSQIVAVQGALPSGGVSSAALLNLPHCGSAAAATSTPGSGQLAAGMGCGGCWAAGGAAPAGGALPGEGLPCRLDVQLVPVAPALSGRDQSPPLPQPNPLPPQLQPGCASQQQEGLADPYPATDGEVRRECSGRAKAACVHGSTRGGQAVSREGQRRSAQQHGGSAAAVAMAAEALAGLALESRSSFASYGQRVSPTRGRASHRDGGSRGVSGPSSPRCSAAGPAPSHAASHAQTRRGPRGTAATMLEAEAVRAWVASGRRRGESQSSSSDSDTVRSAQSPVAPRRHQNRGNSKAMAHDNSGGGRDAALERLGSAAGEAIGRGRLTASRRHGSGVEDGDYLGDSSLTPSEASLAAGVAELAAVRMAPQRPRSPRSPVRQHSCATQGCSPTAGRTAEAESAVSTIAAAPFALATAPAASAQGQQLPQHDTASASSQVDAGTGPRPASAAAQAWCPQPYTDAGGCLSQQQRQPVVTMQPQVQVPLPPHHLQHQHPLLLPPQYGGAHVPAPHAYTCTSYSAAAPSLPFAAAHDQSMPHHLLQAHPQQPGASQLLLQRQPYMTPNVPFSPSRHSDHASGCSVPSNVPPAYGIQQDAWGQGSAHPPPFRTAPAAEHKTAQLPPPPPSYVMQHPYSAKAPMSYSAVQQHDGFKPSGMQPTATAWGQQACSQELFNDSGDGTMHMGPAHPSAGSYNSQPPAGAEQQPWDSYHEQPQRRVEDSQCTRPCQRSQQTQPLSQLPPHQQPQRPLHSQQQQQPMYGNLASAPPPSAQGPTGELPPYGHVSTRPAAALQPAPLARHENFRNPGPPQHQPLGHIAITPQTGTRPLQAAPQQPPTLHSHQPCAQHRQQQLGPGCPYPPQELHVPQHFTQQCLQQQPPCPQRYMQASGLPPPLPVLPATSEAAARSEEVQRAYQATWEQMRAVYHGQG